jgi:hypothetical protein
VYPEWNVGKDLVLHVDPVNCVKHRLQGLDPTLSTQTDFITIRLYYDQITNSILTEPKLFGTEYIGFSYILGHLVCNF